MRLMLIQNIESNKLLEISFFFSFPITDNCLQTKLYQTNFCRNSELTMENRIYNVIYIVEKIFNFFVESKSRSHRIQYRYTYKNQLDGGGGRLGLKMQVHGPLAIQPPFLLASFKNKSHFTFLSIHQTILTLKKQILINYRSLGFKLN